MHSLHDVFYRHLALTSNANELYEVYVYRGELVLYLSCACPALVLFQYDMSL